MRKLILFLIVFCTPSLVVADGYEGPQPDFPLAIDVEAKRKDMRVSLPTFDPSIKRLDALRQYNKDLEAYRLDSLEGLNAKIRKICVELKDFERWVNSEFARGAVSRLEKADLDKSIQRERAKCGTAYASISPYFKIYYDFFKLYQAEIKQARIDLDKCYSNDICRLRKE